MKSADHSASEPTVHVPMQLLGRACAALRAYRDLLQGIGTADAIDLANGVDTLLAELRATLRQDAR
jgi:hypothetical protein